MRKTFVLYVLLCTTTIFANAQPQIVVLKDTIGDFVFDALVTEMDTVEAKNSRLIKYFKYIGTDSVKINRTFTSDPHYICQSPYNQILKKDSIYSFTVCFSHQGRVGNFHKSMGFNFSNGQGVLLTFKGFVKQEYTNYPLEKILEPRTDNIPCKCDDSAIKKDLNNRNRLTCERIKDYFLKWDAFGNEIICDKVYFSLLRTENNFYFKEDMYNFAATVFQPLRIITPYFAVNLTPCNISNQEIEIDVLCNHDIERYEPNFDYENFDRTAKSYFDALKTIVTKKREVTMKEILYKFLRKKSYFWYDDNYHSLPEYISRVNTEYNIEIPMIQHNYYKDTAVTAIIKVLQENDINFEDFTFNEFVLQKNLEDPKHTVTEREVANLGDLFDEWLGNTWWNTISKMDKLIYPVKIAVFHTKQIGIEISTDIIQHWDNAKNKKSKPQKSVILANLSESLKYSNIDGLEVYIKSICPSVHKISGTDILFSFSNARYGRFADWEEKYPDLYGLMINNATFQIPYKKGWIMAKIAKGEDILLNNYIISGKIEFQICRKQKTKTYIITNTDKGEIVEIPVETLKEIFLSYKEIDVEFENSMYSFYVKFSKNISSYKKQ